MQDRIRDDLDECGPSEAGLLDWSEVAFTPLDPDEKREQVLWGWIGVVMVALVIWACLAMWLVS